MSQQNLDYALEQQKHTKELLGQVLVRMGVLASDDVKAPLIVQEHLGDINNAVKIAAGERQLLGELLVHSGHITNDQLDLVIAEQQRSGEKIGEVFKRLGILTQRQLNALLDFQINQQTPQTSPLRLGELLVATGHITREQLEDALRRQELSNKKLGEVLVEAGYILPSRVKHGIRLQKMLVKAVLAAILSLGVSTTSYADPIPDSTQTLMKRVIDESGEFSRLSATEAELSRLVNNYREANGLPPVSNSRSLNKVARMHAIDLVENRPIDGTDSRGFDCSLHSWSNNGSWTPVCYTKDHAYAKAMWDKPREITNFIYTGDGYENAYATSDSEVTPANVLKAWKASPSHNALILESGIWKSSNLLAFGVGIYKNVAVIWFGSLTDPLGPMNSVEIALK
ncbi:CAP domain-containing protein [Geobacter sp. OR-1]|uniref:CAP domain-containing protein n=1 Tax=Geobacter sp. OR-1 TaxID=1266765 RepID=UPI001364C9E6|nr:CAP domain-containing protein [Geobacter sp. OR-1]